MASSVPESIDITLCQNDSRTQPLLKFLHVADYNSHAFRCPIACTAVREGIVSTP